MNQVRRGTIEMTTAMTISGTIGWFVLSARLPLAQIVFWRCAFGAVTLLVGCAVLGHLRVRPSFRSIGLSVLGGVAFVANWLLLFAAFPRASIGLATVVYNTQPFMLVLLGAMIFRERPSASAIGWLLVAFAGVLLIVLARPIGGTLTSSYVSGVLLALVAAFCYALAALAAKALTGTPPPLIVLIQLGVGCLMLAPFAAMQAPPASLAQWGIAATVGILHTGVMCILLYGALQKLPTHVAGSLSFIYPVVAIMVDALAFGHWLSPIQVAGALLILAAVAGTTLGWSFRARGRVPAGAEL